MKKTYASLNMEDITRLDYEHPKKLERFNIKYYSEYHVFHFTSNMSSLVEVFKIFQGNCNTTYKFYSAHFLFIQD